MLTTATLLCWGLLAAPDLSFSRGELAGWEGQGFRPTSMTGGPSLHWGVQSSDGEVPGRTALLYRAVEIPADAEAIVFQAGILRPDHLADAGKIDVLLELPGGKYERRQGPAALPRWKTGQTPTIRFDVSRHTGKTVRLLLIDQDDRPGCSLVCSGFRTLRRSADAPPVAQEARPTLEERQLIQEVQTLAREKNLSALTCLESKHFLIVGNAGDELLELLLFQAEAFYPEFLAHFRQKGFAVQPPASRLHLLAFDSQAGFEAYLNQKMPDSVTGLYVPRSNRLVVYDFARNRTFTSERDRIETALQNRQRQQHSLEHSRQLGQFRRDASEFRATINTSTILHELTHQLAFNCGLLNRQGDTPAWLVEGMAVYFEATINGNWQGPGEANRSRAITLAQGIEARQLLTLRELVTTDDWLTRGKQETIWLGYSQGWVLFRLLMREHPRALRRYLELIQGRRTPDHRWTDFAECFGPDVAPLERAYREYLKEVATLEGTR